MFVVYFFVVHSPVLRHLSCLHLMAVINEGSIKFTYRSLCGHMLLFLLGKCLGVELLAHMVSVCFTLSETAKLCCKVAVRFWLPTINA